MKLRNKKTGKVVINQSLKRELEELGCSTLKDLEEWEVLGEYSIDGSGMILPLEYTKEEDIKCIKEIGNYFATKEEAEKALEKIKAWKRLKDKGLKPIDWAWHKVDNPNKDDFEEMVIKVYFRTDQYVDDWDDDLDLLFSQEGD